jgi:hypothetical protein
MLFALALRSALAADDFESSRFYYGDIHSHTGASGDGGSSDMGSCLQWQTDSPARCGAVAEIGALARENGLDFLATVDHVTSKEATTTPEQWVEVFQRVNALNDPDGGFVTLPGAEVFAELPDGSDLGHRSLLFFGDVTTLEAVTQTDVQPSGSTSNEVADCAALSTFMDGLTARFGAALLLPHHPGVKKPMSTDWNCFDPVYEPLVEVYSEHGSSMDAEWTFDVPWSGYAESGTVATAIDPLKFGLRVGFGAGTDNHDTHPGLACGTDSVQTDHPYGGGLTVVVLPEAVPFDRAAIHAAMVDRHTYATTGPRVPMVMEVQLTDGSPLATMGEAVPLENGVDIVVEARLPVEAVPAVVEIAAVGPDAKWVMTPSVEGTWSVTIPGAELPQNLFVDVTLDGGVIWAAGCPDGGTDGLDHLWSSPVWFDPVDDDQDRDGYTPAEGDCDDENPNVNPGANEACGKPEADQDCDGLPAAEDPDCARDTGDTGDTGDSGGGDSRPVPIYDSGEADTATPATHRCACGGADRAMAGVAVAGAALAAARRRRPA